MLDILIFAGIVALIYFKIRGVPAKLNGSSAPKEQIGTKHKS